MFGTIVGMQKDKYSISSDHDHYKINEAAVGKEWGVAEVQQVVLEIRHPHRSIVLFLPRKIKIGNFCNVNYWAKPNAAKCNSSSKLHLLHYTILTTLRWLRTFFAERNKCFFKNFGEMKKIVQELPVHFTSGLFLMNHGMGAASSCGVHGKYSVYQSVTFNGKNWICFV